MVIIKRKKYDLCEVNFGWLVDIINNEKDNTTEFWLSYPDYSIKLFMFGIPTKNTKQIREITQNLEAIIIPYKQEYQFRFMEEEEI